MSFDLLRVRVPSRVFSTPLRRLIGGSFAWVFLTCILCAPATAATPPVPSTASPSCGAVVGGACYVNGTFTLSAYSAGAHHYRFCRSNDTTGWGGCNTVITNNSGSILTVSGSHVPSDGYRRAYYVSACDSADNCTAWGSNAEVYVRMDTTGPTAPGATTVACAWTSGGTCWVTGSFTVSASPATDSGVGVGSYQVCRSNDTSGWGGCNVSLSSNAGTSYTVSGSHLPSDGYQRAYYFRAQDRLGNWGAWNDEGYVRIDRYAPTVSATGSSTTWFSTRSATISAADATGGAGSNSGLAAVRYRWNAAHNSSCTTGTATNSGATLTAPEGNNTLYLCARDFTGRTKHWSGTYRVDGSPPTQPGPTTFNCAYTSGSLCWVQGSFVASAAPSTDSGTGVVGYRFCRSADTTGWGGCNVDVVPIGTAGTSVTVSGSHLPADGYKRAYYFRAKDGSGNWSPWNDEGYVQVDRYAPTVSASGSSTEWFSSRGATISAADATGGAASNSGLAAVRYRWNAALNAACTNGTATSSGATLTAPEGDNTLYLCARDRTGRAQHWSGTYRVDAGPPSQPGPTVIPCTNTTGTTCWVTGSFVASAAPSTDGGGGVAGYRFCRSADTEGWGGCNVDVVPIGSAGTSVTVSGTHLPADGYQRAYYFRAIDNNGNWSLWNDEAYARIDRYDPVVSATGSSEEWLASSSATITASDTAGGESANSGLVEIRYRWSAALNAACTNGTVVASGDTLTAPEGGNILNLCARDVAGRVGRWSGPYRVDTTRPVHDSLTLSSSTWSIGDGSTYQITAGASDAGSGVRELRTLINYQGDNAANPRGYFAWRDQALGHLWSADQVACTGGGFASKHPTAYSPETVTLVGCSTSLSGGQRTVVFTVRPEASFGEFGPIHDISLWARDFSLLGSGWRNYDLNFSSGTRPPASLQVRDDLGNGLGHGGSVAWGSHDLGASNGQIAKTFTVKNKAAAGSANLLLEHSPSNLELSDTTAFSIGGTLASPLAAGQEDTFTVRLNTNQPGTHTSVLKIWHNDAARPIPLRVNLSATVLSEPTVASTTPDVISRGQATTITVQGQNLWNASVYVATEPIEGEPSGPRVYPSAQLVSVNSAGTQLQARINAQDAGIDGFYNLAIETPGGMTAAPFRVVGPEPVIDVWTPSQPVAGRVHVLQIMGENLAGAEIVPMSSGVRILDLDNSNDQSLSGLMFVSGSTPPGDLDLRIDGRGGSTILPMELQPDVLSASIETREVETAEPGAVAPRLLLQDPISAYSPEELAGQLAFSFKDGTRSSVAREDLVDKNHFCFSIGSTRTISFTAILVSLFDDLGDPLTREALNSLLPGQRLDFTSLTLGVSAFLQFEFYFQICENGVTDLRFCIRGGIAVMVPAIGGWSVSFDICTGFNNETNLAASGGITEHSYGTTNPCIQANDLHPPGFPSGERQGEVVSNCCEDATLTLRTSGVLFERGFEVEGALAEVEPICVPPASINLRVQEVSFLEDLEIRRDQVGSANVVQDPVWSDPDLDGQPLVEDNPVGYVREQRAHVVAKLVADPPPSSPTAVRIRATAPSGLTFESEDLTVDSDSIQVDMTSVEALPSATRHWAPLDLQWSYTTDGDTYVDAGTTRHDFYVTLAPPISGRDLTLTALSLGVGGGGQASPTQAFLSTWSRFAGPANIRTWDGRALKYYPAGIVGRSCPVDAVSMLTSANGAGQCGAFAYLLMDALAANGVDSRRITVTATDGTEFLVKDWQFLEPSFPGTGFPWELELQDEGGGAYGMVPLPPDGIFGDLKSLSGIPGQNSPTPAEKGFIQHFIVFVPDGSLSVFFYDPSYGQSFSTPQDFQNRAIAGFYTFQPGQPLEKRKARMPDANLNITFSGIGSPPQ